MTISSPDTALVVLSGGQDSVTCLYWARHSFAALKSVTFDYGQRHRIEIEAARKIAGMIRIENRLIHISSLNEIGGSALTDNVAVDDEAPAGDLPNTFVPGRNLIFLTLAAACAYREDIHHLVTGVCQTDYSGYPDCRQKTITALQEAITLGMDYEITIHTPLMHLTKAQSVRMAQDVGALEALAYSHTCYNGTFPPCQHCPACKLRAKGFHEAGVVDPLLARAADVRA